MFLVILIKSIDVRHIDEKVDQFRETPIDLFKSYFEVLRDLD